MVIQDDAKPIQDVLKLSFSRPLVVGGDGGWGGGGFVIGGEVGTRILWGSGG